MATEVTSYPPLMSAVWPASDSFQKALRVTLLALVGTALLTLSAKINIPFYPVPMTMQTFMVMVIGMAYGWRLGTATVLLYLVEGALGMPVFAGTPEKGLGVAYMLGGTGGYLVGFVFAAAACGWLAERGWDRRFITTAAANLIGNLLIFAPGLLWLGILFGWDKPILAWGLTPFLLAGLFKLLLASAVMPASWSLLHRLRASR